MSYTAAGTRAMMSTGAVESPLELIEINHPDLAVTARFVNDNDDFVFQGNLYLMSAFTVTRPKDASGQVPKARISIDNINRDLTVWLEQSGGGKGAKCTYIVAMRSEPSVAQYKMVLDLTGISIDNLSVSGELGYQNTLLQPVVAIRYDPIRSPGLF